MSYPTNISLSNITQDAFTGWQLQYWGTKKLQWLTYRASSENDAAARRNVADSHLLQNAALQYHYQATKAKRNKSGKAHEKIGTALDLLYSSAHALIDGTTEQDLFHPAHILQCASFIRNALNHLDAEVFRDWNYTQAQLYGILARLCDAACIRYETILV